VTIVDGSDRLREVCNYVVTLDSIDPGEPLLRRFADSSRIQLMHRKYASLDVLPQYKISYGALLYDYQGVDQVNWAVRRLRGKRETKSATITFHTPGHSELSCLSLLDFKIRDEALCMTAVYRSQNVYASQPGNLLALRAVQERVAADVDAAVGGVTLLAISAHIYESDVGAATEIIRAYDADRVK
jgi:thymidylate synthase